MIFFGFWLAANCWFFGWHFGPLQLEKRLLRDLQFLCHRFPGHGVIVPQLPKANRPSELLVFPFGQPVFVQVPKADHGPTSSTA